MEKALKHQIWEFIKHLLDGISLTTTVAALVQILPAVSALFSTIWLAIRIWETDTVRQLRGKPVTPQKGE